MPKTITFSAGDAAILLQALYVAQMYYEDASRQLVGMYPPDHKTVVKRLNDIEQVSAKIIDAKL